MLDSIARAISLRNAKEIARRMPLDSSVIYVSDGRAIGGPNCSRCLRTSTPRIC